MDIGLLRRTCLRQLKFRGLLVFLYGGILTILLYSIAQLKDLEHWGLLLSIVTGFGAVLVVQCFLINRFFCMIRRQEQQFNIYFADADAKPLWKGAAVHVTEDWCIIGGTAAFYRGYIKDVTWQYERRDGRVGSYYLIVKTLDGRRCCIWLGSKSGCAKIRRWWKTETGEVDYGL